MRKNRVLAVIMAVLMMVTLLPSMVFAAAVPQGALDGKLKVKGTIAVGVTLSADYSKVKPEGITDDYVSFSDFPLFLRSQEKKKWESVANLL